LTLAGAVLVCTVPIVAPKSAPFGTDLAVTSLVAPRAVRVLDKRDAWVEPPAIADEAFAAEQQGEPPQGIGAAKSASTPELTTNSKPVQAPAAEATSPPLRHTLTPAETAAYIARARTKIQQGDIAGARRLLERASEGSDRDALFALAETYDPRMLAKWGVLGTKPDLALAKELYGKAAGQGAQGAKERLLALGN